MLYTSQNTHTGQTSTCINTTHTHTLRDNLQTGAGSHANTHLHRHTRTHRHTTKQLLFKYTHTHTHSIKSDLRPQLPNHHRPIHLHWSHPSLLMHCPGSQALPVLAQLMMMPMKQWIWLDCHGMELSEMTLTWEEWDGFVWTVARNMEITTRQLFQWHSHITGGNADQKKKFLNALT